MNRDVADFRRLFEISSHHLEPPRTHATLDESDENVLRVVAEEPDRIAGDPKPGTTDAPSAAAPPSMLAADAA